MACFELTALAAVRITLIYCAIAIAPAMRLRKICEGCHGTIYELEHGIVLKTPMHDPPVGSPWCRKLKVEYDHQALLLASINTSDIMIQLPSLGSYHESIRSAIPHALRPSDDDTCGFTMERVPPIPAWARSMISDAFFPVEFRRNATFISKLILGDRRDPFRYHRKRFFSHVNFKLYANDFPGALAPLSVDLCKLTRDMGSMLGRIHYSTRYDGADIEFVMGADRHSPDALGFYCIDFGLSNPHNNSLKSIVDAVVLNEKFFPRPDSPYWIPFITGYKSAASTATDTRLAASVVHSLELKYNHLRRHHSLPQIFTFPEPTVPQSTSIRRSSSPFPPEL